MAEGNDPQVTHAEPTGQEPHGAEPTGGETVSKEDYDKLLAQSRKWEKQSKANAEKAKAYDELKASTQTDAEKLADATKRAEDAEAKVAEYERKAERAGIVAEVAAAKGVDADWLGRMAGETREEIEANAGFIAAKLAGTPIYPNVTDNGAGKGSPGMTPDEIEKIKDPIERLHARAELAARNRRK